MRPLSNGAYLLMAVQVLIICFGGLMLGIKIEHPEASIPLHPAILVIAISWAILGLGYLSVMHKLASLANEDDEETNDAAA